MIQYITLDNGRIKIPYKYEDGVICVYVRSLINAYPSNVDVNPIIRRLPDMFKEFVEYKDIVIDKETDI